jgi:hypothetical protein
MIMKHMLKGGVPWAIGLLMGLAAAAQTSPDTNTNTTTNQPGAQVSSNSAPIQNIVTFSPSLPPVETNGFETQTNLTNEIPMQNFLPALLGVIPSQPPLLGPGTLGSSQPSSPLLGTRIFGSHLGAVGVGVPTGPGIPVWGPVDLHTSLSYSFTYGTGIETQPNQQTKTVVQTISAGFLFDLGPHWQLTYSPAYSIYSDPGLHDSLSCAGLTLTGATAYQNWAFSFAQTYVSSDEPLIETGTQTSQEAYGTSIGATYQMSSRVSLQFGLNQSIRDASGFDNVDSWSGSSGVNYQLVPNLGAGLSFSGGYDGVSAGSSMTFESLEGSITFHPGKKLRLSLSGGVEDLQFINPTAPSLLTPVFSAGLNYQLFRNTLLSAGASRSVTPSYFGNQVEVATTVGASIAQRLSPKLSLSLNAGYSTEPLIGIVPGQPLPQYFLGTPPRTALVEDEEQNSTSVGVGLSYAVLQRVAIAAFYSVSQNSSSQSNYKYSSSQIGFSVSYSY